MRKKTPRKKVPKKKKSINNLIKGAAGGVGGTGLLAWALNEMYNDLKEAIKDNNDAINVLINLHLK